MNSLPSGCGNDVFVDDAEREPPLDLSDSFTARSSLGRPLVGDPVRVLADECHVGRTESGLLLDLPPHRIGRLFPGLDATLRQLPGSRNIRSFECQDGAVLPLDHGDDAGAEVSAGHQRAGYGLTAEGTEPSSHIDEFGVLCRHALEPAGRLQRIAGAIVKVTEHVPLAQVMDAHATRLRRDRWPSSAGRR